MIYNYLSAVSQQPFIPTILYAFIYHDERTILWEENRSLNPPNDLPWVINGDFNCYHFRLEKIGGNNILEGRLGQFNSLIFDIEFTDITSTSMFYT